MSDRFLKECEDAVNALQEKGVPSFVAPAGVRSESLGVVIRADAAQRLAELLPELPELPTRRLAQSCGQIMVGSGGDTYDPLCELPEGHAGSCKSTMATDQHRIWRCQECACLNAMHESSCVACGAERGTE